MEYEQTIDWKIYDCCVLIVIVKQSHFLEETKRKIDWVDVKVA